MENLEKMEKMQKVEFDKRTQRVKEKIGSFLGMLLVCGTLVSGSSLTVEEVQGLNPAVGKMALNLGVGIAGEAIGGLVKDEISNALVQEGEIISMYSSHLLDKIVELNDLSTFLVNYSGIATVYSEKKTQEVLYHVTYDSTVKLGIDFNEIKISIDVEKNQIEISLPNVKVNDFNVRFESLDFMFMDTKSNTATVASEAYQVCVNDVKVKSLGFLDQRKLAIENAEKIIEGLMYPFLQELGDGFQVVFR